MGENDAPELPHLLKLRTSVILNVHVWWSKKQIASIYETCSIDLCKTTNRAAVGDSDSNSPNNPFNFSGSSRIFFSGSSGGSLCNLTGCNMYTVLRHLYFMNCDLPTKKKLSWNFCTKRQRFRDLFAEIGEMGKPNTGVHWHCQTS
jgi:hypothetical protein